MLGSSRLRWLDAAALALCCSVPARADAADLVVDSLGDTAVDGDGQCTLREAIRAAEANADFNDCRGTGAYGADVITFALSGTLELGAQLPDVTDAGGLTIDGAGQAVTISGRNAVASCERSRERRSRCRT